VSEEQIPASVLEKEEKIASARAKEEGKPDKIVPKIVEGYIKKFKDENVLLRQAYIRDDSLTIQDLINQNVGTMGENIIIRRFVRYELGEESTSEAEAE
jgi:elongation factor Ts